MPADRLRGAVGTTLAWLATRGLLVVVIVHDLYRRRWIHARISRDVRVDYFAAARGLAAGKVPYLGFHYEYPPGTLPLVGLARLASGPDGLRFTLAWVVLALAADALTLVVLARWSGDRVAEVGLLWVLGVAALGPVALLRNDLFVTTAFVLGAWWAATGRPVHSGLAWGAGVLLKLWPAVPMAVLVVGRRPGRWRITSAAAAVLGGTLALLAALGAVGPMVSYLSGYQGSRPLEVESLWANAAWLHALATGQHLHPRDTFHSLNLVSPAALRVAAWANHLTTLLQAGVVAGVLVARRVLRRDLSWAAVAWVWLASLTASFVLTPVLSPQYAVWLVGAAAVVLVLDAGAAARAVAVSAVAVSLMSQAVYPFGFGRLLRGDWTAVLALTLRNATIVGVLVLAVLELARRARRARPDPPGATASGGPAAPPARSPTAHPAG